MLHRDAQALYVLHKVPQERVADEAEVKLLDEGVVEPLEHCFKVVVIHRGSEVTNRIEIILDYFDLELVSQTVGLKCAC